MSENATPKQTPPAVNRNEGAAESYQGNKQPGIGATTRRINRYNKRSGNWTVPTYKGFVGTIPKIGGVIGLHNENVTKK